MNPFLENIITEKIKRNYKSYHSPSPSLHHKMGCL